MAEQKNDSVTVKFCKIETTVSMNEDTYEIKEEETMVCLSRDCKLITFNIGTDIFTAYRYTDEDKNDKISVYAIKNDASEESPIYEDFWFIKLTVKKDNYQDPPYIYINFIRNINDKIIESIDTKINESIQDQLEEKTKFNNRKKYEGLTLNTNNIIDIITKIARTCEIYKIVLQDDAEFPCNNELKYGIKALQLRALQIENLEHWNHEGKGKLSIYQSKQFKPTKYTNTEITGCIKALQKITCKRLKDTSFNLKNYSPV